MKKIDSTNIVGSSLAIIGIICYWINVPLENIILLATVYIVFNFVVDVQVLWKKIKKSD